MGLLRALGARSSHNRLGLSWTQPYLNICRTESPSFADLEYKHEHNYPSLRLAMDERDGVL